MKRNLKDLFNSIRELSGCLGLVSPVLPPHTRLIGVVKKLEPESFKLDLENISRKKSEKS